MLCMNIAGHSTDLLPQLMLIACVNTSGMSGSLRGIGDVIQTALINSRYQALATSSLGPSCILRGNMFLSACRPIQQRLQCSCAST